jgi:hypothetical protein
VRAPSDPPGAPASSAQTTEWSAKAVDAIDNLVAAVNDRAVRPVLTGARAVVFGLLIAITAIVVLIVVIVALIRLLDVYVFPGRVWASYAVIGLLFTGVGLFAWSRRSARTAGSVSGRT